MCAQDSRYEEDKKLKQDEETFGTSNEWMNPGNVSCAMNQWYTWLATVYQSRAENR